MLIYLGLAVITKKDKCLCKSNRNLKNNQYGKRINGRND